MAVPEIDLVYGAIGVAVISVVLAIWALTSASRTRQRYLRVFGDERPEQVEQLISTLHERVDQAVDQFDGFGARLTTLEARAGQSINRIGMVRFNPFMDTGSDLSFSVAFLNDLGDGLVLTSLWGRDEVRLYAKPVEGHESRYALSQEEKQALDMASHSRNSNPSVLKA